MCPLLFVAPPAPALNCAIIGDYTVSWYAQEGCNTLEEMYASALSPYRFNNTARTSTPYRELWRLSDPLPWDATDWAENIRWAKEQFKVYGSMTWLEREDHLAQITSLRLQSMWVSDETIVTNDINNFTN